MCSYVRSLKVSEGKKIQSLLRRSKNRTVVRRAHIVLLWTRHACFGNRSDNLSERRACPPIYPPLQPFLLRQPFTRWSLEKLSVYLKKTKVVSSISLETLRQIFHEQRVSLQRTKTWKESNDSAFESKTKRLKRLYRAIPKSSHVVCLDEFGSLELRPSLWLTVGKTTTFSTIARNIYTEEWCSTFYCLLPSSP